eukprot:gb/GECH01000215.1/.p1 GENE.gb/GECH01000215.1/~~gb/GECH01000215.1/.p1  ORF type:complete len:655 (+),score=141.50 gb/GECH01000215.1/:1-1965(+)
MSDNSPHSPFPPQESQKGSTLEWKNISWEVEIKERKATRFWIAESEKRNILNGVSGRVRPGELVAIVGASGSGKTSLLNILSGQMNPESYSGEICIDGNPTQQGDAKEVLSYVTQDDVLTDNLTPRELLKFRVMIGLDQRISKQEKLERVEQVLRDLNITQCANTRVGANGMDKLIAGGEKKRVRIAMALLSDPRILMLDEPTSGLDTSTALSVVEILRDLASNRQKTILTTIHQPNTRIVSMFDRVIVMAGGNVSYDGPVSNIETYLEQIGFPCDSMVNPVDRFMELIAYRDNIRNRNHGSQNLSQRIEYLTDSWSKRSVSDKPVQKDQKETHKNVHGEENEIQIGNVNSKEERQLYKPVYASWLTQFRWLLWRSFKSASREKMLTRSRLISTVVMGLVGGTLFWQLSDNQAGIRDRQGGIFYLTKYQITQSFLSVLFVFSRERDVFFKENFEGLYSVAPYYLSKLIVDVPVQVFYPWLFATIIFFMMGLRIAFVNYIVMTSVMVLAALSASSLGFIVSSLFTDISVALSIAPTILSMQALFSGYFITPSSIPIFLRWITRLSFLRYSFDATLYTEFDGLSLGCSPNEYVEGENGEQVCPYTQGKEVIDKLLDMEDFGLWKGYLALSVFVLGLRLIGGFTLSLHSFLKRRKQG